MLFGERVRSIGTWYKIYTRSLTVKGVIKIAQFIIMQGAWRFEMLHEWFYIHLFLEGYSYLNICHRIDWLDNQHHHYGIQYMR